MPSIFNWIIQPLSYFFASLERTFLKLTQPARYSIILSACAGQKPHSVCEGDLGRLTLGVCNHDGIRSAPPTR